jgi:hypothetical protein
MCVVRGPASHDAVIKLVSSLLGLQCVLYKMRHILHSCPPLEFISLQYANCYIVIIPVYIYLLAISMHQQ